MDKSALWRFINKLIHNKRVLRACELSRCFSHSQFFIRAFANAKSISKNINNHRCDIRRARNSIWRATLLLAPRAHKAHKSVRNSRNNGAERLWISCVRQLNRMSRACSYIIMSLGIDRSRWRFDWITRGLISRHFSVSIKSLSDRYDTSSFFFLFSSGSDSRSIKFPCSLSRTTQPRNEAKHVPFKVVAHDDFLSLKRSFVSCTFSNICSTLHLNTFLTFAHIWRVYTFRIPARMKVQLLNY